MAYTDIALKLVEYIIMEDFAHQSHILVSANIANRTVCITYNDACRFLSSVL